MSLLQPPHAEIAVDWKAATQYETSGDIKIASPERVMFQTTTPNQSEMQSFTSEGGMLSVSATAQGYTDTVTAYITGSQVAGADITQVTTNMYCPTSCCSTGTCTTLDGGQPATPNLFTIAYPESGCQQFALREWAYARPYDHSHQSADALLPWLHSYNHHRPHQGFGGRTPISRLPKDNLLQFDT